jgi:hypothetical protein
MTRTIYKLVYCITLISVIFGYTGCRTKVSEKDIIGKWVYKIDLPESKTGLKDIYEATVEFFDDKTFKMVNMPAVIMSGGESGLPEIKELVGVKGEVLSGSGKWEIYIGPEGQEGIELHFFEIRGGSGGFGCIIHTNRWPFGKVISLYTEYAGGSELCIFHKMKEN